MIKAFGEAWGRAHEEVKESAGLAPVGHRRRAGLEAVLAEVPDVEPFTFAGYPDNEVYLHPCGTIMDVLPGRSDVRSDVEDGVCDCENTAPWRRVYVERGSKS
jgi:hypothetical protein